MCSILIGLSPGSSRNIVADLMIHIQYTLLNVQVSNNLNRSMQFALKGIIININNSINIILLLILIILFYYYNINNF